MTDYKKIELTKGQVALVDAEDYDELSKYKWHARPSPQGVFYAQRAQLKAEYADNKRKITQMHRQIMGVTDPDMYIDHINHNTLDNRKSNLRKCNSSQNQMNSKPEKGSSSKYLGVSLGYGGKFRVSISVDGVTVDGGYFKCEIEAAKARDALSKKHFGEFAYLNFK